MKKLTIIFLALLLISQGAPLGFAENPKTKGTEKTQISTEIVRGKIVSIDTTKFEIVIRENKTGNEKTIVVDQVVLPTLQKNDEIKATLKPGSNVAEKIKKIIKPVSPTTKKNK